MALLREAELQQDFFTRFADGYAARYGARGMESLYLGGGMPSLLPTPLLRKLLLVLLGLRKVFVCEHAAEVTVELNPEDISVVKFAALREHRRVGGFFLPWMLLAV